MFAFEIRHAWMREVNNSAECHWDFFPSRQKTSRRPMNVRAQIVMPPKHRPSGGSGLLNFEFDFWPSPKTPPLETIRATSNIQSGLKPFYDVGVTRNSNELRPLSFTVVLATARCKSSLRRDQLHL